jgi:hypothetical protein
LTLPSIQLPDLLLEPVTTAAFTSSLDSSVWRFDSDITISHYRGKFCDLFTAVKKKLPAVLTKGFIVLPFTMW